MYRQQHPNSSESWSTTPMGRGGGPSSRSRSDESSGRRTSTQMSYDSSSYTDGTWGYSDRSSRTAQSGIGRGGYLPVNAPTGPAAMQGCTFGRARGGRHGRGTYRPTFRQDSASNTEVHSLRTQIDTLRRDLDTARRDIADLERRLAALEKGKQRASANDPQQATSDAFSTAQQMQDAVRQAVASTTADLLQRFIAILEAARGPLVLDAEMLERLGGREGRGGGRGSGV